MSDDVDLEEYIMTKDDTSGADIKAIVPRPASWPSERRMKVTHEDFKKSKENYVQRLAESRKGTPEGLYLGKIHPFHDATRDIVAEIMQPKHDPADNMQSNLVGLPRHLNIVMQLYASFLHKKYLFTGKK